MWSDRRLKEFLSPHHFFGDHDNVLISGNNPLVRMDRSRMCLHGLPSCSPYSDLAARLGIIQN